MFRLIGAGFRACSRWRCSPGFVFVTNLFTQHLVHKTVLSLIAWVLFGVLLIGRIRYGWRGRSAVRWTLSGFGFLALAYFGVEIRPRGPARAALGLTAETNAAPLPRCSVRRAWRVLLLLAAFFAGSETALMSLNRYRLRHRAKAGNRGARLAENLLAHPDRLIGLILLLSTIVNVAAPMLVGFIALRLGGEFLVAFGAVALTLVLLIFCEVAPKTFGALHPERLALPAAYIYTPLLLVLYPFVWATNLLANGVLRLFGVLAAAGLEFPEQRRIAHRRGGSRRDDSASPPADAGEHSRSGERHRGGHHGAAQRNRRHRRRR